MHTRFRVFGKRPDQSVGATNRTGAQESRLFYVTDVNSSRQFLVDTGAAISVFPPNRQEKGKISALTLQAVNGTRIPTFGERSLTLDLGLRRRAAGFSQLRRFQLRYLAPISCTISTS